MKFNKGIRDHLACLGHETRQRMISEKDYVKKNPNSEGPSVSRPHSRKLSEDVDLFTRTVKYVTNTVCNRHPKLKEMKDSMVVPVAKEKVK